MDIVTWLDNKIKEASVNGDFNAYDHYSQLKEMWVKRLEEVNKKGNS